MNFYASPGYLETAAEVYFPGRQVAAEDVSVGDEMLRLLVVEGRRVITSLEFLDYHEPLPGPHATGSARVSRYVPSVARGLIEAAEWELHRGPGVEPAPFVDWGRFASFEDYKHFLRSKSKRLLKDQERRRRRLAETLGPLAFAVDDRSPDVLELAAQWKWQQLHDTGARNYLAEPNNLAFLRALQARDLLTSSTLRADGRLLAVWLGFMHEGVWSGWIFTYDHAPELKSFSLGHQLLHSMLEESHRRGHREFDFSIGDEDYKWFYATDARVIAPLGTAPLRQRLLSSSKAAARRALSLSPELLEALRRLKKRARQQQAGATARLDHVRRSA